MNWQAHHEASEKAAVAAHEARRNGREDEARSLFDAAATEEAHALDSVSLDQKPRTYGITAVSAVALLYKAARLKEAEHLAHQVLAQPDVPSFAIDQLRELLQTVWNDEAQAATSLKFVPGQITVSVDGGEVVRGGAPLDLIVERVQTVQAIFFRTA